jgi:hypothetical protein
MMGTQLNLILAFCCTMFFLGVATTSCQKLMDRAEQALECDEEVDIDLKWKIDFKDKAEKDELH